MTTTSIGEHNARNPEKIDSSTAAVFLASTVTVRCTLPAVLFNSIVWRPALMSAIFSGVLPRILPSIHTCAPEGVEEMSRLPFFDPGAGAGAGVSRRARRRRRRRFAGGLCLVRAIGVTGVEQIAAAVDADGAAGRQQREDRGDSRQAP